MENNFDPLSGDYCAEQPDNNGNNITKGDKDDMPNNSNCENDDPLSTNEIAATAAGLSNSRSNKKESAGKKGIVNTKNTVAKSPTFVSPADCKEAGALQCEVIEPDTVKAQRFFLESGLDLSITGSTPGRILASRQNWVPDNKVTKCFICLKDFTAFHRRHHCRRCGRIICDNCSFIYSGSSDTPTDRVLQGLDRSCKLCFHILLHSNINTGKVIEQLDSSNSVSSTATNSTSNNGKSASQTNGAVANTATAPLPDIFHLPDSNDRFNGYVDLLLNSFLPINFIDSQDHLMVAEYVRALRNCVYHEEVRKDIAARYKGLLRRMVLLLAASWRVLLTAEQIIAKKHGEKTALDSTLSSMVNKIEARKEVVVVVPVIGLVTYTPSAVDEKIEGSAAPGDVRAKIDSPENERIFVTRAVENLTLANASNLVTQILGFFINFTANTKAEYSALCVSLGLVESLLPGLSNCIDFVKREQTVWCLRNVSRISEALGIMVATRNVTECLIQCLGTPCKNLSEFTLAVIGNLLKAFPTVIRNFVFAEVPEEISPGNSTATAFTEGAEQRISVYNAVTKTRSWYVPTTFLGNIMKMIDASNTFTLQAMAIRCIHAVCFDVLSREYILTKTPLIQKIVNVSMNTSVYQHYSRLCSSDISHKNIYGSNSSCSTFVDYSVGSNMSESGLSGIGLIGASSMVTCSFNKLGYSMATPFITGALASELVQPTTTMILNSYISPTKTFSNAIGALKRTNPQDVTPEIRELYGDLLHLETAHETNDMVTKQKRMELEKGYVKAACYALLSDILTFYSSLKITLEDLRKIISQADEKNNNGDGTTFSNNINTSGSSAENLKPISRSYNAEEKLADMSSGLYSSQTKARISERLAQIKSTEIVSGILLETIKKQSQQLQESCLKFIASPALVELISLTRDKNLVTPSIECSFLPYMIMNNREFIRNIFIDSVNEQSISGSEGINLLTRLLTYSPTSFFALFTDTNGTFKITNKNRYTDADIVVITVEELLGKLLVDNFSLILERVFVVPTTTVASKKFLSYICELALTGCVCGKKVVENEEGEEILVVETDPEALKVHDKNDLLDLDSLSKVRLHAKIMAESIQDNSKYVGIINNSTSESIRTIDNVVTISSDVTMSPRYGVFSDVSNIPVNANSADGQVMFNSETFIKWKQSAQSFMNNINVTRNDLTASSNRSTTNPDNKTDNRDNDVLRIDLTTEPQNESQNTLNIASHVDGGLIPEICVDKTMDTLAQQQCIYSYITQVQQILSSGKLNESETMQAQSQLQSAYTQLQLITSATKTNGDVEEQENVIADDDNDNYDNQSEIDMDGNDCSNHSEIDMDGSNHSEMNDMNDTDNIDNMYNMDNGGEEQYFVADDN